MALKPRVVFVHRRTEYDEMLATHGTRGQAAFFLRSRGRSIEELVERHRQLAMALGTATAAIPEDWRRGRVERADVARFLFAPDDVVVVVGQDGLVANVSKYLDGQPVIGIDPEPGRNAGVLVRHPATDLRELLHGRAGVTEHRMVEASLDDGQHMVALNEIFIGHRTHQSARYTIRDGDITEIVEDGNALRAICDVDDAVGANGNKNAVRLQTHPPISQCTDEGRRQLLVGRKLLPAIA